MTDQTKREDEVTLPAWTTPALTRIAVERTEQIFSAPIPTG